MKTSTILSVFSLVLILTIATTVTGGDLCKTSTPQNTISYVVNVYYYGPDPDILSLYQVVIVNEKFQPVTFPQRMTFGVIQYEFVERGPVEETRIAIIQLAPSHDDLMGWYYLVADPCFGRPPFNNGSIYLFELHPKLVGEN